MKARAATRAFGGVFAPQPDTEEGDRRRLPRGVRPRGSQPPAGHLPRPEGAEDADAKPMPGDPRSG